MVGFWVFGKKVIWFETIKIFLEIFLASLREKFGNFTVGFHRREGGVWWGAVPAGVLYVFIKKKT